MGKMRNRSTYNILIGNIEGKTHPKGLGVNGKMILKWITRNRMLE
jgi:hypothetical protein